MCRFVAYLGHPICLNDLICEPENSLINQSKAAKEMHHHLNVNADGFGVAWYVPELDDKPGVFKTIRPAWNDFNIDYMMPKLVSGAFLAHIRAASHGGVGMSNTHPFKYDRYSFIHNGTVHGFPKIKRHLRHLLCDEIYEWVLGQTDSEHVAALFLQNLPSRTDRLPVETLASALLATFSDIKQLQKDYGVDDDVSTTLNYVVTDGEQMVISHYATRPEEANTLYYAYGEAFGCESGICEFRSDNESVDAIVFASEKLDEHAEHWHEVPANHIALVERGMAPRFLPIEL